MFKFMLAFLVWLFATGKYSDWLALVSASSMSTANASGSTQAGGTGGGSGSALSDALGALGSLTGSASGDSQLLGPMGYSPADSGVPK